MDILKENRLQVVEKNNGCHYRQIIRVTPLSRLTPTDYASDWVIYSQAYAQDPSQIIGYEIFQIREKEENAIDTFKDGAKIFHTMPAREKFPSREEWGTRAYSRLTLETALRLLRLKVGEFRYPSHLESTIAP